ncbi:uncharacterized protein LOC132613520 [Lycium barbarum]|uniref:uncharacterized protein LOC132613520 n=1 Tax=Lycium barbarum TaxID=112863 RepID=UPI00293E8AE8|nr:uncharacterized protein LOC132613520 [Lycium barbarum]
MVQNKFDVLNTVEEGEIPCTSTSKAEGENSNANGNKDGQSNQVENRLNNANTTHVSTQGQLCDQEVMPDIIQEKEVHSSRADEAEAKELNTGERQYEDGEQINIDGDSSKKDSVEDTYHGGTNTDNVEEGTNTTEKRTSLRQVEIPDKEEVEKQTVYPDHDEHVDFDDTGLDGVKEATEGSPSVTIHNPEQREGKVQENVQSIESTVVDVTSDKMKEQVYMEQDGDPPDHSSSEKAMVISHTDHQQVTFCRKSSLIKELHDLISHNIDGLEVEEDVRDLLKEDKEENIKQNK